jgi:hypothetical protein
MSLGLDVSASQCEVSVRNSRAAVAAIAAIILAACSQPEAREQPAQRIPQQATGGVDTNVVAIAVEGEGLRLFVIATGAARPMPFGADSALVHGAITRAAHAEPVETGAGADCPGSFARWENGLTLRFDDSRFVGWSVRGGDGSIASVSGIGIGATRTDVESAMVIRVSSTSLGAEFTAGEMAGVFSGTAASDTVTALWAGEVCIAR